MNTHKATIAADILDQEDQLQINQRAARELDFFKFYNQLSGDEFAEVKNTILKHAENIGLKIDKDKIGSIDTPVKTQKAPVRDKKIK